MCQISRRWGIAVSFCAIGVSATLVSPIDQWLVSTQHLQISSTLHHNHWVLFCCWEVYKDFSVKNEVLHKRNVKFLTKQKSITQSIEYCRLARWNYLCLIISLFKINKRIFRIIKKQAYAYVSIVSKINTFLWYRSINIQIGTTKHVFCNLLYIFDKKLFETFVNIFFESIVVLVNLTND